MAKSKGPKVYAVAKGRSPGIYNTWAECQQQTNGYSGAVFKSFKTSYEAQAFIDANKSGSSSSSRSAASKKRSLENNGSTTTTSVSNKQRKVTNPFTASSNSNNHQLKITIYFDGGSRGNPGLAGAGAEVVVIENETKKNTTTYLIREYCGTRETNNYAEYRGLLAGLKQAKKCIEQYAAAAASTASAASSNQSSDKPTFHLQIYGDSNLIIQQLRGAWQCKNPNIYPLYCQSVTLIGDMKKMDDNNSSPHGGSEVSFDHVYRDQNKIADALANEAMDQRKSWTTTTKGNNVGCGDDDDGSENVDGEYIPLGKKQSSATATGTGDKKPPAVVASKSTKSKNGKSAKSKQEVIDVNDSDNESTYSV